MRALDKHLLILEPLLTELAPLGWFRKGQQLWRIDRREGYALMIGAELHPHGTFSNVRVHYGTFWNDVRTGKADSTGLGSSYFLGTRRIPFDTFHIDSPEQLEDVLRRSAAILVEQLMQKVVPILRTIHHLPSFVQAAEALDALDAGGIGWSRSDRHWHYLALGDRQQACAFLDRQLQYSWRDAYEQIVAAQPPEEQDAFRTAHPPSTSYYDQREQAYLTHLQHQKDKLLRLSDADLPRILAERRAASEAALAAYIGKTRWQKLS